MADVFDGNESESEITLSINKNYADRYNKWRKKEELQKLKDRYGKHSGENLNSDDSSSSEDEDENATELTQQIEKQFYKTLSCLKKKDPRIYDENVSFFEKQSTNIDTKQQSLLRATKEKKQEKPLFLRDYERKLLLEKEGKVDDESEKSEEDQDDKVRSSSPTLVEEQKAIKDSFKSVLANSDDDEEEKDSTWGGLFQQRKKTKKELEKENEDYLEWLKGQKEHMPDEGMKSDLKFLHDYWNDPKLDVNEAFLRDYILNKKFLAEEDEDHIPTYEEIVHDSDDDLSEDEKTIEKQEEFEHKFNFRFEEPDKEFIKRYPRTLDNSLRKKDERRKRKREEIRERREAEKAVKREEVKQLKAMKRKEIMERIEKIKSITGNNEVGFKDDDLEKEFNPEEYDKRMSELFNDEYYGEVEEVEKPLFPDLDRELEIEDWNSWNGRSEQKNGDEDYYHEPHCEDPDFNMDCDYDPTAELQKELIKSTKGKKQKRRQSKFAQVVAKSKPVFDPNDKTFDEYVDEYYKLDFEDIIGDLPCRFKYRKVMANDFGLTVDEILKADDKELNQWCSLKKTIQHRPENVEMYDVKAYKKKGRNEDLKRKTFISLYSEEPEDTPDLPSKKKRKRKSSIHDQSNNLNVTKSDVTEIETPNIILNDNPLDAQLKKRKKSLSNDNSNDMGEIRGKEENNLKIEIKIKSPSTKLKKMKRKKKLLKQDQNNKAEIVEGSTEESNKLKLVIADTLINPTDLVGNNSSIQDTTSKKKRRKKKKKKRNSQTDIKIDDSSANIKCKSTSTSVSHNNLKKFKNKKYQMNESNKPELAISDARLKAYGIKPKKYKNKLKYGNKAN